MTECPGFICGTWVSFSFYQHLTAAALESVCFLRVLHLLHDGEDGKKRGGRWGCWWGYRSIMKTQHWCGQIFSPQHTQGSHFTIFMHLKCLFGCLFLPDWSASLLWTLCSLPSESFTASAFRCREADVQQSFSFFFCFFFFFLSFRFFIGNGCLMWKENNAGRAAVRLTECRRFAARQPDNELEAGGGSELQDNMTSLLRIPCQRLLFCLFF